MIYLSVLMPTVYGREEQLSSLLGELHRQIIQFDLEGQVEILTEIDNKEMTIGEKRDRLYLKAKGLYSVQIDDDDMVNGTYLKDVIEACKKGADCVGYLESVIMDGIEYSSIISLVNAKWETFPTTKEGLVKYLRTPFFKVPIKTSICQIVGVQHMRYGEDHDFAIRIKPLLNTEVYIGKTMYFYESQTLTKEQHNKRYGITK